jgi:phage terminase Nu1 subunit (DNA packaging protein)
VLTPHETDKNFLKHKRYSKPRSMTPKTKPKMTKSSPSPRRADGTLNNLCKALGLSKRRVSELLSQGLPDDPQAAIAWRAARENDDSAAALRRERIGLVKAQRLAVELSNQKAQGELVAKADVIADHVRIGSAVACFIRALERELPQLCLGLPLNQSAPLVKKRVRELQNILADMQSDFWKSQPTTDK